MTNDNEATIIRDQGMTLVTEDDGMPVTVGQRLTTFRGEEVRVTGGSAPHKPSSTGRVRVTIDDGETEFFPGVIKTRWIEDAALDAMLQAAADRLDRDNQGGATPGASSVLLDDEP